MTFTRQMVRSGVLDVALETAGPADGWPVVLLHGFPFDPTAYEAVAAELATAGARVLVPYLRGFGPTRFVSDTTPRSGQQSAIGRDVLDLVQTLALERPVLVGYDWGGRAACIAAALRPDLVGGLVALGGYSIQDIAASGEPALPDAESGDWYQYYFLTERGRAGLTRYRRELAARLWQEWSPQRAVVQADLDRAVPSFDNPDFVEVVLHSYRHRLGHAPGTADYAEDERRLAELPPVDVPTVVLDPTQDPMLMARTRDERTARFTRLLDVRLIRSGHNQPYDAPTDVARAVVDLHEALQGSP